MKAIVLVGGEGTRLRPLTLRTPKQLVPVLGRPLLLHLLEHLRDHGFDHVTLAMTRTPGSAAVYAHFQSDAPEGVELSFVFEDTPLGSGGAIANAAAGWIGDAEPFLVCNGDLVTDIDLTSLVAFHRDRQAAVTIALHEVDDPTPFGVVALEEDGCIARFVEKPAPGTAPSNLVNAGFWVFDPAVVAELDASTFNRIEDKLFPTLAAEGRGLYGIVTAGSWRDVGYPDAYLEANLALLQRTGDRVSRGPGTAIAGDAVVADSVLGAGCTIEPGASVSDSVLWDGVRVGRGASVHRSVIASGAIIEGGAYLDGAVLGHGATVPAGVRLSPGARVEPGDRADLAGAAASV